MKITRLLQNYLLICEVVIFLIIITSCEKKGDDSGPDKLNDPDIPENEAYVNVTGSGNGTIKPEKSIKVEKVSEEKINSANMLVISWNDANGNKLLTRIVSDGKDIGTGVYKVVSDRDNPPSQYSYLSVTFEGDVWRNISGESGTITLTTNNQNRVAGTLNEVTVDNPCPDKDEKLILNGEFNALKGVNYGPADSVINIINLSGLKINEKEDIIARNSPQYQRDGKNIKISWRDKHTNHRVLINIFGLEEGEISRIPVYSPKDNDTQRFSPPFAYMKVIYEGITFYSITRSAGTIWLDTNNKNRLSGHMLNIDVKGKPEYLYYVNGQINVSK